MALNFNRAENYEQPTYRELRPDNIVMDGTSFLLVSKATPEKLEATFLLGESNEICEFSYDYIIGVDLKDWILNPDIKRVIDVLLIGNGFKKLQAFFVNYEYHKFVQGRKMIINNGGWFIDYKEERHPVSFLHEVQNKYFDLTGELLGTGNDLY